MSRFTVESCAIKAVQQTYNPDSAVLHLLDEFRLMMNHCIQIGLEENVSSLKALSLKSYPQLSAYDECVASESTHERGCRTDEVDDHRPKGKSLTV